MSEIDRRLRTTAATQHGLLTSTQVAQAGLNPEAADHRLGRGVLDRLTPRVLRIGGCPSTREQGLLLAVFDAGPRAALSHTTALSLWGVRGFVDDPIHVVRHRDEGDRPPRGTIVHEVRSLPSEEIRVLDQIPVVSPALALLQLAGMRTCSLERLARAVDAAWADRLVSYRSLTSLAERMSARGRRGLTAYRAVVEERGPGYVPPASNLESRFAQILERAGRRPMRRQVDTGDGERWIGRVDFRDDDLPVVVEVQSERFHRGLTAERDDRERMAALRRAGLEVIEITDADVFHRPDRVVAAVDAARDRARARRAAA
jgi:very-short-patch-repair endonuclease